MLNKWDTSRAPRMAALVAAGILMAAGAGMSAPARVAAATTPGYPSATVEYMASTRTLPYIRWDTYWGYALHNWGWSSGSQTVSVSCWYDADWANGTNRWFRVLVWESYDGYGVPRWLFVNASYVHSQPVVRKCYATSTGIW